MERRLQLVRRHALRSGLVAGCLLAAALAMTAGQAGAQQRGGRGGSGGRGGAPQGGVFHARREVARTREPAASPRYVPPPSIRNVAPRVQPAPGVTHRRPTAVAAYNRPAVRPTAQGRAGRSFTRTAQGRRYDNGMQLRHGVRVTAAWQRGYFPRGVFHYPFYCPSYSAATVCISPFGFYFGVCAPFILRTHCLFFAPAAIYIDVPIYSGAVCDGYAAIPPQDNYLDLDLLRDREPGLANAVDELREGFGQGNVDALVALTDPNGRVAVFERGRYKYSLASADFIDMTRDAVQSIQTVAFDLTEIHERAAGVYAVSGEHLYTDKNGNSRKVFVSYVLEDLAGTWTLTQVGTAPDRVQKW